MFSAPFPARQPTQVQKALAASGVSLLFTAIVTCLAFTKIEDMRRGDNSLVIPVRKQLGAFLPLGLIRIVRVDLNEEFFSVFFSIFSKVRYFPS